MNALAGPTLYLSVTTWLAALGACGGQVQELSGPQPNTPLPNDSTAREQSKTPEIERVACSPDGGFCVSVAPQGSIRYMRTEDGETLRTFYHCQVRAVQFSPDGRWLASAGQSCGGRSTLKIWEVAKGTLVCEMQTHLGGELHLSISPDGEWLANTCGRRSINLWHLPSGTLQRSVRTSGVVSRLHFSEQSRRMVADCADGTATSYSIP